MRDVHRTTTRIRPLKATSSSSRARVECHGISPRGFSTTAAERSPSAWDGTSRPGRRHDTMRRDDCFDIHEDCVMLNVQCVGEKPNWRIAVVLFHDTGHIEHYTACDLPLVV